MKNETFGVVFNGRVIEVSTGNDISNLFRSAMINAAVDTGTALKYDYNTQKAKRIMINDLPDHGTEVKATQVEPKEIDPIFALITNSAKIKPNDLEISDIKWKYLIRSAVRGKNIMMVGPAGCGKTQAAKALPVATGRPFFYFNLGATQDPRSTLIGNTHFKDGATTFDESAFVKAIQTENAVILLDEL